MTNKLYPEIEAFIEGFDFSTITKEREDILQNLIDFIQTKKEENLDVRLNFICTHNSRRSHLSQIWAQTLAAYYNVTNVYCYSGGTEATALFSMVAETLQKTGFRLTKIAATKNPVYSIKYGENEHPIIGFSKTFDDPFNPTSQFGAVMTCSHADENCPFISGADKRIPLTFEDPKLFDNTPQQAEKYHERSIQIATELCYVFSKIQ